MRVLTDVVAVDREFDYEVPEPWQQDGRADRLAVGTMVRVTLQGRRVGGWVTALDPEPEDRPAGNPGTGDPPTGAAGEPPGASRESEDPRLELGLVLDLPPAAASAPEPAPLRLQPLAKLVGPGPAPGIMDLARWAAWRWAGRTATFCGTASPPRVIESVPRAAVPPGAAPALPDAVPWLSSWRAAPAPPV